MVVCDVVHVLGLGRLVGVMRGDSYPRHHGYIVHLLGTAVLMIFCMYMAMVERPEDHIFHGSKRCKVVDTRDGPGSVLRSTRG